VATFLFGHILYVMLYVFHGGDIAKSANKARALVASLCVKRPDATFVEIIADQWSPSAIEENLGGQGLFSSKYIIFLNRVTENTDAKEVLPDLVAAMNESSNIFILLEAKLNADLKRAVEKDAEKIVLTDVVEKIGTKEEFNIFALGDALERKDGIKAWRLYRAAIDSGIAPENIVGTLFWQIKRNYSKEKSGALLKNLITLYHDGHRGLVDMELGIERMLVLL
jgi:DNA polymerase III delta subunit